jgi:hypothetical protein
MLQSSYLNNANPRDVGSVRGRGTREVRTPMQTKYTDAQTARFWPKVQKGEGCWEWAASRSREGYGRFFLGRDENGKHNALAHRFAYEVLVGPIPEGLQLDHLCRNPPCVNPAHLEPVTSRENSLRGEGLVGQRARQTHCLRGHPLSGSNVLIRNCRPGSRVCRACLKTYDRERSRRRRAA